ncbi:MAG: LamG domain-containing protein [Oceanipulchritudo sp.]
MKNKLYPTLTSLLAFCAAYGVQVYEGFDYTIPGDLVGSGGIGWSTGWGTFPRGGGLNQGIGGEGSITAIDVQAETIAAPTDYTATRNGGETVGVDGFPTAWREFASANRISTTADGTVYFSYLFKMDAISAGLGGSYLLLELVGADRADLFKIGVGVGLDTAAILDGSNNVLDTGETITAGTSYLLIGKLETGVGADTLRVNVYASSETIGSEPTTWEMTASADLDAHIEIDRIGLLFAGEDFEFPGVDHTGYIDELRFGDTFASVISDPALPVADGVKYTFETVTINSPEDDETPNDLPPDPDTYDLVLPAIQGGAANAIAVGAGRDGGNAFNPDVSGYAVLPSSAVDTQFDGADALTIMGWYKSSSLAPGGRIADAMIGGNANGFFFRVNDVLGNDARLRLGDGSAGVNVDTAANYFINDGNWQFFAVTWDANDSGNVKFYRGDEVTVVSLFESKAGPTNPLGNFGAATTFPQLTFGVQGANPSSARFTGLLDDIQIYAQALTLEEIQAIHGVVNPEVAAYSFETVQILAPSDDKTPNDFLPDPDAYDLGIPAFKGGAATAIAFGAGRNGGNVYDAGNASQGYVVLPGSANDTALDGADALTIMGWYKSSSLTPAGRIADAMISGNANGFFFRVNDLLGNDARLRLGDGSDGVNVDTAANYFIADGTWQFFAVTWDANDSGNVNFYRGDESTAASVFQTVAGPTNPLGNFGAATTFPQLTLGAQAANPGSARFTGLLDDIKIYKSALTLTEIEAIRASVPLLQPVVTGVVDTGTNVEVSFETVSGLNYQLQVSTDLSGWSDVAGQSVAGDGSVQTLVDPSPTSGEKAFYRVRVE